MSTDDLGDLVTETMYVTYQDFESSLTKLDWQLYRSTITAGLDGAAATTTPLLTTPLTTALVTTNTKVATTTTKRPTTTAGAPTTTTYVFHFLYLRD